MRDWNLGAGDPLCLRLAADFRHCTPDYANDHIWEVQPGGGDPPAFSLRTTYGLRARQMRIYPVFSLSGQFFSDPASFFEPPRLRAFSASYLRFTFQLQAGLHVNAETRVLDSHCTAGRFTIHNQRDEACSLLFQLCGQLVPMDGKSLEPAQMQAVHVLAGRTLDLAPVVFLTGGPLPGQTTHPSLAVGLALAAGGVRTLTWTQAALGTVDESFNHARRSAARPWDPELARLEMLDEADTVEVRSGDADLDAAFALSQRAALGLFLGGSSHLPQPSFVLARQPDHGNSPAGDGGDHDQQWSGQSTWESLYMASVLPGVPNLLAGLVRNNLAAQSEDGTVDCKPGLAGQQGRWLAPPLLASLSRQALLTGAGTEFAAEVFPKLDSFLACWLSAGHDRDGDGFPEWDHPQQAGMDEHPLFSTWQKASQGVDITCVESPMLGAMLAKDQEALALLAEELGKGRRAEELHQLKDRTIALVEACRDSMTGLYHVRDRDSHASLPGGKIGTWQGNGAFKVSEAFLQPVRLLVRIDRRGRALCHPQINLHGQLNGQATTERLESTSFHWQAGRAVVTTDGLFSRLKRVEVSGLADNDRLSLHVIDLRGEDVGLLLPLWAGVGSHEQWKTTVAKLLREGKRFWRPFGIPFSPRQGASLPSEWQAVYLPWNVLIGEGLVQAGFREEAADLVLRLMQAIIRHLKEQHAFASAYDGKTGSGLGEHNSLPGMAPLGLFLKVLGVEFRGGNRVKISGKNPFSWAVTVKYRGLTVTRHADHTEIVFPDGQSLKLDDPTDGMVAVE